MGMHVDIRRSDGRVHTAIISEVRKESQSVTVEWFENVRFYEFFAIIESNKCFGLEVRSHNSFLRTGENCALGIS